MMVNSLFVYGTLKQHQLRGRLWPHPPLAIETAVTRGELYDLGSYPGIAAGSDWVLGELWTLHPQHMPATLQTLDSIEGYDPRTDSGPYLRRTIEVHHIADNQSADSCTAYTYGASGSSCAMAGIGCGRRVPGTASSGPAAREP